MGVRCGIRRKKQAAVWGVGKRPDDALDVSIGLHCNRLFRQAPHLMQIAMGEANIDRALRPSDQFSRSSSCLNAIKDACISGSFSRPLISTPISRVRPDCCAHAVIGDAMDEPTIA